MWVSLSISFGFGFVAFGVQFFCMFFPKVFLWILIWIIGGLVVPVLFRFFQAFLWDLGDLKWLFCTVCLSCSLGFCIVILALGGSLPVGNSLNSPLEFCIFFWLFGGGSSVGFP